MANPSISHSVGSVAPVSVAKMQEALRLAESALTTEGIDTERDHTTYCAWCNRPSDDDGNTKHLRSCARQLALSAIRSVRE